MQSPAPDSTPTASLAPAQLAWRLILVATLAGTVVLVLWCVEPRKALVPVCGFYRLTGLHCPGCGAIRATHELLHGRFASALTCNALWVLGWPLALYAGLSELLRLWHGRPLPGDLLAKRWLLVAGVVVAGAFGILRNIPAAPFTWLAPF